MNPSTGIWGSVASVYDWQLALERPALRAVVKLAALRAGDQLLDVGTGTGGLLRELAGRSSRPVRAVGVDSSSEMLAAVRHRLPECELVAADARALPFADESFDVVTASYVLHVLDRADRTRVLEEIYRVLRPEGRLATVTPVLQRTALGRLLLRPVAAVAERSSGLASGLRSLDPRAEMCEHFTIRRVRWVNRGYPSVCVLASPRPVASIGRGCAARPARNA